MDKILLERMNRMDAEIAAKKIIGCLDVELQKLEEVLLQERLEAEFHGEEVTSEFREKLLEEIREKCICIEE